MSSGFGLSDQVHPEGNNRIVRQWCKDISWLLCCTHSDVPWYCIILSKCLFSRYHVVLSCHYTRKASVSALSLLCFKVSWRIRVCTLEICVMDCSAEEPLLFAVNAVFSLCGTNSPWRCIKDEARTLQWAGCLRNLLALLLQNHLVRNRLLFTLLYRKNIFNKFSNCTEKTSKKIPCSQAGSPKRWTVFSRKKMFSAQFPCWSTQWSEM